ncbi:MAG: hypothetical protein CM1200mP30_33790 [Pseudomonadota bacterium]|nr:MAG: hypothetical protein CM1200mP30_33790 [Pseudomonadota bacterium]
MLPAIFLLPGEDWDLTPVFFLFPDFFFCLRDSFAGRTPMFYYRFSLWNSQLFRIALKSCTAIVSVPSRSKIQFCASIMMVFGHYFREIEIVKA